MKKMFLIGLLCILVLLTACAQAEEDTEDFSGVINEGKSMGYEYTVTKDQDTYTWEVGLKGTTTVILETPGNEEDLEHFRKAVSDSESELVDLIISLCYLFIIAVITLFLFKKNRKVLKDSGPIIAVFAGIAIYIAFGAFEDLFRSIQDAQYYYSIIIHSK
ncbi:geobacillin-26 family protein [Bacillus salacetis]|uniref:geobacillin-26 family protein n=1 Tax=Bacillus salacetis TaxID=2315464 RepID=UPI003BA0EFDD